MYFVICNCYILYLIVHFIRRYTYTFNFTHVDIYFAFYAKKKYILFKFYTDTIYFVRNLN